MNLSRKINVKEINRSLFARKVSGFRLVVTKHFSCGIYRGCLLKTVACFDQAILDRVVSEWKSKLANVKAKGNAVFVLGPMGAGKSTRIHKYFKTHPEFKNYAYVDTDEIMGTIDAFSADKVDVYYRLARKVAINLTDWILTRNISFVAEGTCVEYSELIEYMERLKETGYNIQVNPLVADSLETIIQQSKQRKNRIISEDVVAYIYKHAIIGLEKLYEYNEKVHNKLFDELAIPSIEGVQEVNCSANPFVLGQ